MLAPWIQSLRVPIVGADIVEYNHSRDHHNQTAMVAAKLLKEIAAANGAKGQRAGTRVALRGHSSFSLKSLKKMRPCLGSRKPESKF